MYVYIYIYIYKMHMYVNMYDYVYVHVHVHVHVYEYVCMYIYIYIYIYIYYVRMLGPKDTSVGHVANFYQLLLAALILVLCLELPQAGLEVTGSFSLVSL